MIEFPRPDVSRGEVTRVGEFLSQRKPWTQEVHEEFVRAFRVAYHWRDAHQYPTRRIRAEMGGKIRTLRIHAVTASRTKRMASIRKKLMRSGIQFARIQDLGGCRAIMPTAADVGRLVELYRSGVSTHGIQTDTSYIEVPKASGYRTHHFVFKFRGEGEAEPYSGLRIEMQLRSRLQHAWATAVEAVGMVRREDLKAGEGNSDWLRLFVLMSSEFAELEDCPMIPGTEDRLARRQEIQELDRNLGAAQFLDRVNNAIRATENLSPAHSLFLIQYDGSRNTVAVRGYSSAITGSDQYGLEETDHRDRDSVLVEVDKAENLREAYPNYFLDVSTFADAVLRITERNTDRAKGVRGFDTSFLRTGDWRKRL